MSPAEYTAQARSVDGDEHIRPLRDSECAALKKEESGR
jgi:hypothetical protein